MTELIRRLYTLTTRHRKRSILIALLIAVLYLIQARSPGSTAFTRTLSLPQPSLSPEGKRALDDYIHKTAGDKKVPAVFFGATNGKEEIYFGCAGEKVFGKPGEGEVTPETTLHLFSLTKFITTIACMQAVEKGLISLDDPSLVEKHCSELWAMPILEGYTDEGPEITRPRKNPITLRHLLTHTSGLSYPFNTPMMGRWRTEHNVPENFSPNPPISSWVQPLIFEPGTRYRYSIGIDWAGFLLCRVLGRTLEEIFQENIFQPCGLTSISFHPTTAIKEKMMAMCTREPSHTGEVDVMEGPVMNRSMKIEDYGPNYSGGGGLFGTARDYLTILRHVLASADPSTSNPLISAGSFKALFTDHLDPAAEMREDLMAMAKNQFVHDPKLFDDGTGKDIAHSSGLFINLLDSKWGRKAGSGFWDGAAKTAMWLDPATGVAAVCCTNLLSQNPDPWVGVYNRYERSLYDGLA